MSPGQTFVRFVCLWGAGVLCATSANAQSWHGYKGVSPHGLRTARLVIQKHEFALRITCNESAAESGKVRLMFAGPAVPRLYGTDGQEETLLLSFNMPDGSARIRKWNVYYFDGGLGDQAWLGELKVGGKMLDAFSGAKDIAILNTDKELIYNFPAKGSAAGAKLMREACGVGQTR